MARKFEDHLARHILIGSKTSAECQAEAKAARRFDPRAHVAKFVTRYELDTLLVDGLFAAGLLASLLWFLSLLGR